MFVYTIYGAVAQFRIAWISAMKGTLFSVNHASTEDVSTENIRVRAAC